MKSKNILLISAIITIIALFSFLNSPFFQVRKISLSGHEILSDDLLMKYLNTYKEKNIIFLKNDTIVNRLKEQENYIKKAKVIKDYPNELEVMIDERKAIASIINKGVYIVFDKEGIILENNIKKLKADVPVIKGIGYSFQGDKIEFNNILNKIVIELTNIESALIQDINLIKYKKDENGQDILEIEVLKNVQVHLGKLDNLAKKFDIMLASLRRIKNEKMKVDYIDLRYADRPVYKLKN